MRVTNFPRIIIPAFCHPFNVPKTTANLRTADKQASYATVNEHSFWPNFCCRPSENFDFSQLSKTISNIPEKHHYEKLFNLPADWCNNIAM